VSREHANHSDISAFADECVNLKREDAAELREQVWRLRDKLEAYLNEHPDFELRKMLLSGSLAKGTALKSLNDIDVACYISANKAPSRVGDLIQFLAERLRQAFPNFKPEQVTPNSFSVTVQFISTGLRVDVVPVLYEDDAQWRGYLVSRDNGEKLLTSIPMHLEFIRKRKEANKVHFAQLVRLLKFWVRQCKKGNSEFRLKSFMSELIVAHLADSGLDLGDYTEALAGIFAFIGSNQFKSVIAFADYYSPSSCKQSTHPIRIWDPVNCDNNVAKLYTEAQRTTIVEAALDAGDAIDSALRAPTKAATIAYWQKVFGPSFKI
jgi:tRNA nucleotidyltransferase (CCA-adding enzyme)